MARYEDEVVHGVDGIEEYDNPAPAWLVAILWGSVVFAVLYIGWYALAFGDDSMTAGLRDELVVEKAKVQDYFAKNPIVPPTAEDLLAAAVDPESLGKGRERFLKTCAPCHGENGQGLIGPNLTDNFWIHGGKAVEIFTTVAKGVPAKGMPPWGRALKPEELRALVGFIRSLNGTNPANGRAPEGNEVAPEPIASK